MELSVFNIAAASDNARRMTFNDPRTNKPMLDENGVEIAAWFLGAKSTVARNKRAEQEKEAPAKPDYDADPLELEAWKRSLVKLDEEKQRPEMLAALCTKLEGNWQVNDKQVKPGSKELVTIFRDMPETFGLPALVFVTSIGEYLPKM